MAKFVKSYHLRRLHSAIGPNLGLVESTIAYLIARKSKLDQKDLLINVVMDEVHCLQSRDVFNGAFYGFDFESGESAKTLFTVMIRSIAGRYRDVVCMSPIHKINHEKIRTIWMDVIKNVTEIGFDVVATTTSGHQSNVSFFELLVQGLDLRNDARFISNPFNKTHYIRLRSIFLKIFITIL